VFDRLFGRGQVGAPNPQPFPPSVKCGAGCGNTEGYRCPYVDSTGARCGWWCANHSVFMQGRPWCRRHASIVRWLKAKEGTFGEPVYEAAIDDRSPNLVAFIVDMVDVEVLQFLRATYSTYPRMRIHTDDEVRLASISAHDAEPLALNVPPGPEGRQKAWERGWSVYSDVGYLTRIVLRATATEPPMVHLYVNDRHILSRAPDWIANRGRGTDAEQDRDAFRRAVVDSVISNVSA
jgi:hypothetical protein